MQCSFLSQIHVTQKEAASAHFALDFIENLFLPHVGISARQSGVSEIFLVEVPWNE